jgi:hypothetical protein
MRAATLLAISIHCYVFRSRGRLPIFRFKPCPARIRCIDNILRFNQIYSFMRSRSLANVTSRILFEVATPMHMMAPINPGTLIGVQVKKKHPDNPGQWTGKRQNVILALANLRGA